MVDIDHFKQINDTYGHGRGDACPVEAANILSRAAGKRPTGLVACHGGEEPVILLTDTERSCVKVIAEQVRRVVEQAALPVPSVRGVVTANIGVAAYASSADHVSVADATSEALMQADMALYDAKHAGRDAVMVRQRGLAVGPPIRDFSHNMLGASRRESALRGMRCIIGVSVCGISDCMARNP